MKNCIATFSWKIKFKNYFAYAVSFPERCTLLIRKENNEWLIEDIRTWGNKPPSPITIELVESWLSGKDVPNEVLENIPDSFYQRGFAQKSHDSYQYQIFNNDGNYENVGDDTYYDNEDNDDEYLACFSREDACPTNLPGKIDGWVRIYYDDGQFYTEDWKVLPIPAELRHDFLEIFEENFIYIHPKIPLLYAAIEQHGATAESLEFISLENGKISYSNMKGMTKQELLLTSALRQRISYLLNIQTLMEKTHSS